MICYPSETDWSSAYTETQLEAMRADEVKAAAMEYAEALAWSTLAALCAWQIGICPTTVRPAAAGCFAPGSWLAAPVGSASMAGLPIMTIGSAFTPHLRGGNWYNGCGCSGAGSCSCSYLPSVTLPGPVGDIERVVVNGQTLPASAYRVDDGVHLVRVDGGVWPVRPDFLAPAGGENNFVVTYYQGAAPNELTRGAAGLLAVEFFKAKTNQKCRLPSGVTTLVRNGQSIDFTTGLFINGDTGIPEVNAVIKIYNPHGVSAPSRVVSPDSDSRTRRQTWGAF